MPSPTDPVKRQLWITRQSISHIGKVLPPFTETHRRNISISHTGVPKPPRTATHRKKLSEANRLENHPQWKGGISFEPYCVKFNAEFKERVRAFFGYECVECHKTQEELGIALDVHHVNYDKMMCCNDVKPLFVSLCRRHNVMANHNRVYWQDHYTRIIMEQYCGQCYLPKPCQ